jgi:deoxyadenosine/deoxycytidine kinase
MEQEVPASYLRRLQALYDDWVSRYALGEVLVLDTDRLDYIHDFVHRLDVMQRIERLLPAEMLPKR